MSVMKQVGALLAAVVVGLGGASAWAQKAPAGDYQVGDRLPAKGVPAKSGFR